MLTDTIFVIEFQDTNGLWEIADNGETLEIFTDETEAREALTEWKAGGDAEFYRLASFTRDTAAEPK
jgi:hypothetical protein